MSNIRNRRADLKKFSQLYERISDFAAGPEVVRDKGEPYLPRLSQNQPDQNYLAFRQGAQVPDWTAVAATSFNGLIFSKSPKIELPDSMTSMLKDVTGDGTGLVEFARQVARHHILFGVTGLFVDADPLPDDADLSVEDAEGILPRLVMVSVNNLIDWRHDEKGRLNHVRLSTKRIEIDAADEFAENEIEQVHVLDFADGHYRVRMFEGEEMDLVSEVFPTIDGEPISEAHGLPFWFLGGQPVLGRSAVTPIVEAALHSYRLSADYRRGLQFAAMPQPYIIGIDPDGDEMPASSGPSTPWVFSSSDVKVDYLKTDGSGLSEIVTALDRLENDAARAGARLLASDKAGVESGAALTIRSRSEQATLANVARDVAGAIDAALKMIASWLGEEEASFHLSTDFVNPRLDPQTITALMNAVMSGNLSQESFLVALKKGDLLPEGRSIEEEQQAIADDGDGLERMSHG